MKRSSVNLSDVADWHNLMAAVYRAAKGKRHRADVQDFLKDLQGNVRHLGEQIRQGTIPLGQMTCFHIRDPKPRVIHAPCLRERVLHHAIMAHVGPVLDRALVFDTYACRKGKGSLAAMHRAQQHVRRFPWYAKIDMKSYFASIDHGRLKNVLRRRFKNPGLLALMGRIIDSHEDSPGRGLPIGALTSQHFANYYLNGLDRFLLEQCRVAGMLRYMDDVVWWDDDKNRIRQVLHAVKDYVPPELDLVVKPKVQINRSVRGLPICGYRVLAGTIRLSRRRRRRYTEIRQEYERAYAAGRVNAQHLQAGYASALALTIHAHATHWRGEELRLHPTPESCMRA